MKDIIAGIFLMAPLFVFLYILFVDLDISWGNIEWKVVLIWGGGCLSYMLGVIILAT